MTDIQILYEGPIVKRAEAKELGLRRYFTGDPCKYGHICERYVSTRGCVCCVDKCRTNWRNSNKDKVSAYNKYWNSENADVRRIKGKNYREANRDSISKRAAEYYSNNTEYYKLWKIDNKDKVRQYVRTRRARKALAGGHHEASDISLMLELQKYLCAEPNCGTSLHEGYHVDHIVPLALGGSDWPSNLQCLCPSCNLRKGHKHPLDWARENGRLL